MSLIDIRNYPTRIVFPDDDIIARFCYEQVIFQKKY